MCIRLREARLLVEGCMTGATGGGQSQVVLSFSSLLFMLSQVAEASSVGDA